MTTYTKITKPSGTSYTNVNASGRQQYDDPNVTFDDSSVFYDGINQSQYTNIPKPSVIAIESYSESNRTTTVSLRSDSTNIIGQTFKPLVTQYATGASFYLSKTGSPTGYISYKLYATTGTLGTTSKPTGSALATSDIYNVSNINSVAGLIQVNFNSPYKLTENTSYALLANVTSVLGDASNLINCSQDTTSPTHAGNKFTSTDGGTNYTTSSSVDVCFYLYGDGYTLVAKPS